MLASNSGFSCLSLLSAAIIGLHHHTWLPKASYDMFHFQICKSKIIFESAKCTFKQSLSALIKEREVTVVKVG
jgi:hypothetical protein